MIILLRESTNNVQKNKELLLFARNRIGTGVSGEKTKNIFMNLNRIQDKITIYRQVTIPWKVRKSSNIWENPYQIKIAFMK